MAIFTNNYDVGPDGTQITVSNSAGGGTPITGPETTLRYSSAQRHTGTFSGSAPAGAAGEARYAAPSGTMEAVQRAWFFVTQAITTDLDVLRFSYNNGTSADTSAAFARIQSAHKLRLALPGSVFPWTGTVTLPVNQWIRIEMYANVGTSSTTGSARVAAYLGDSTTPIDDSGLVTGLNIAAGNAFTQLRHGRLNAASAYTDTLYFDDVEVRTGSDASSNLIGPLPVAAAATVRPSALVSNTGNYVAVGTSSLMSALSDDSDTTYVESVEGPNGSEFTFSNGSLSAGNVTVKNRIAASVNGQTVSVKVELLQGTTVISTASTTVNSTTPKDHAWSPTSSELANITDRTALRVRITATSV